MFIERNIVEIQMHTVEKV